MYAATVYQRKKRFLRLLRDDPGTLKLPGSITDLNLLSDCLFTA